MQAKRLEQLQEDQKQQQQLNFPGETDFKPLTEKELSSLPAMRHIEYRENFKNSHQDQLSQKT